MKYHARIQLVEFVKDWRTEGLESVKEKLVRC